LIVSLVIASCDAVGASSAFGAPQHRPMEEMRGGCNAFQLDLRVELEAIQKNAQRLIAWPARGDHASRVAILSPVEIVLLPSDHTALTVKPKRPAGYAGMVPFRVPKSGLYRFSTGSPAWLEVVFDGAAVEPLAFEMQSGCATLFKTVVYRLEASRPYWLEVSAARRDVTILLTEHDASP
jgi:hypothetical protein